MVMLLALNMQSSSTITIRKKLVNSINKLTIIVHRNAVFLIIKGLTGLVIGCSLGCWE